MAARRSPTERGGNCKDWATRMTETLNVGERAINLTQVLKLAGWVLSGGEAKMLIADGHVRVNGTIENRKRRQMAVGDTIEMEGRPPLILA